MSQYLQLLKDIVKIQTDWEQVWPDLEEKRKQLALAMSDPDVKAEVGKYVTTSNRLSRLDLPEISELKQRIAEKEQAVFDSRVSEIYEAQLAAQLADEKLAALLTDDDLNQMRKDLDNLIAEHATSEPQQTLRLVLRRGARLAVNALTGED